MKNLTNLLLLAGGGFLLWRYTQRRNGNGNGNGNGVAPEGMTTRPMEVAHGLPKPAWSVESVGELNCGKVASRMEFPNDEYKYKWIVNCSQSYSSAGGSMQNEWNKLIGDGYGY